MATRKRGNGSIYRQPGCSTWTIQYYASGGKRVRESTGTDDYQAAQRMLRAKLHAVDKGEPIEPRRKQQVVVSELYAGLQRHYRINGRKSLDAVERRWLHLRPTFENMPARNVSHDVLNEYLDKRQGEKAANATINRELACLKTMLRLGSKGHKFTVPLFPHLAENNIRTGFIEQRDFERLRGLATELWLRLFLEMVFGYGWRKQELLKLRVRQVNVQTEFIRLEVGATKNGEGREVKMTAAIRELVRHAVNGKNPDDYLLTRPDGKRVRDFRKAWKSLCEKAGLAGLHIHDFRRSAARELRRFGVAESTIMDIGGWKTSAMFKRYAIKDPRDMAAAIQKREQAQAENSHDSAMITASDSKQPTMPANATIN